MAAVTFVMLNPSTADAEADDPTLRRCFGFATALGATRGSAVTERGAVLSGCGRYRYILWRLHRALQVVNLYAWRSSSPDAMFAAENTGDHIIGPENDAAILEAIRGGGSGMVIAAWGADKRARGRAFMVAHMLADAGVRLHVLGPGKPQHPLYLPGTARPVPWSPG